MTERAWTSVLTFLILCGLQRQSVELRVSARVSRHPRCAGAESVRDDCLSRSVTDGIPTTSRCIRQILRVHGTLALAHNMHG